MGNYAGINSMLIEEEIRANNNVNPSGIVSREFPADSFLDKLLFLIEPVVDYAFGIFIGYVLGRLAGFWAGFIYSKHYEPVYMENLSELSFWRIMPYEFAKSGSVVGVIVVIIALKIVNSIIFRRKYM